MKMNIKKGIVTIVTGLTVLAMAMGPALPAFAQSVSDLLAQIAVLQAQLVTLQQQLANLQGGTGGVTGCTITSFTRNLSQTMTGDDVKCLQVILNSNTATKVATTGAGSPGSETTYFGSLTKAAVIEFQELYASEVLTPLGLTAGTGYVGTKTIAKLNTMIGAGGVIPPAVGAPLTVTLDPATPVAGNILTGEANKIVAKIKLTASATADTTINSLAITSFGTAVDGDFGNVKVFDGTRQLGLTQIVIAGQATFTFAPALTITKNTAKTLDVAVSIPAVGATVMATVKMGVASAASITGATFTGTFPVTGNSFAILPGGALGNLNVTAGAVVPVAGVRVGAIDVVLGTFVVSAGPTEDVDVTQFTTSYRATPASGSTVIDSDVTNIRIKVDGALQGNATNFSLRRATIDLSPAVRVTRGTSRIFQVIGDISAGVGNVIEMGVEANAVYARGVTSGVGLGGPAAAFTLGLANRIGINRGAITVAVSTASPAGTFVRSTVSQTLGVFDVRAIGEGVLVNAIELWFPGRAAETQCGQVVSVGLYNEGGALLSNLATLNANDALDWWDGAGALGEAIFNLNWTVPKDTTLKLYVKGVTNGMTNIVAPACVITDPVGIGVQLFNVGVNSITGTGLISSGLEGPQNVNSNSGLPLPLINISQGPIFQAIGDPLVTPRDQAVLNPVSQATVTSLKVTAGRENQSLRGLILTGVPDGVIIGTAAQVVSGVALYDGATQVTNFVAPVANLVTFLAGDILNPVTFTVAVPKTLKVVANFFGGIAFDGGTLYWTVAIGDLDTAGLTSGQLAANAALIDLRVNSGGLGVTTGGTLTSFDDVIEVVKAADSPTGNIARGTFTDVAIWEFTGDLPILTLSFVSKTGLASVIAADTALFRLYDYTLAQNVAAAASTITPGACAAGACTTVNFLNLGGGAGYLLNGTHRIALQVTTTDILKFPTNSSIHFTLRQAADLTIVGATSPVGFGGTVWSIPADANRVTIQ